MASAPVGELGPADADFDSPRSAEIPATMVGHVDTRCSDIDAPPAAGIASTPAVIVATAAITFSVCPVDLPMVPRASTARR